MPGVLGDHYLITCTVFPSDGDGDVRRISGVPLFANYDAQLAYRPDEKPFVVRAYLQAD